MAGEWPRERYVTEDRWLAEHARLQDRISELEERVSELAAANRRRSERAWQWILAFLTGVTVPLLILAISSHGG